MSADLLTDGFLVLQRLSVAEVEKRIAWLENALASYRTLLIVRKVMINKPDTMDVPKEWEGIIEQAPPQEIPVTVPESAPIGLKVQEHMKRLGTASTKMLIELIGCSYPSVVNALNAGVRAGLYTKTGSSRSTLYHYAADRPNHTAEQEQAIAAASESDREKYAI